MRELFFEMQLSGFTAYQKKKKNLSGSFLFLRKRKEKGGGSTTSLIYCRIPHLFPPPATPAPHRLPRPRFLLAPRSPVACEPISRDESSRSPLQTCVSRRRKEKRKRWGGVRRWILQTSEDRLEPGPGGGGPRWGDALPAEPALRSRLRPRGSGLVRLCVP